MESPREQCAKEGCSGCRYCKGAYSGTSYSEDYNWESHEIRKEIVNLKRRIQAEQRRVESLEQALKVSESEKCSHPNLRRTPFEHDCPDCDYHKERSF